MRMISHETAFDMYDIITSRNVHFGDNKIVQAIRMD